MIFRNTACFLYGSESLNANFFNFNICTVKAECLRPLCLQLVGRNEETVRARAEVQMAGRLENRGTGYDMPIAQACHVASRKDKEMAE
jgi:hypothetical protein